MSRDMLIMIFWRFYFYCGGVYYMNAMYNLKRLGKFLSVLWLNHHHSHINPSNCLEYSVPLLSARQFAEYCRSIAQFTFLSLILTFGSAMSSVVPNFCAILWIIANVTETLNNSIMKRSRYAFTYLSHAIQTASVKIIQAPGQTHLALQIVKKVGLWELPHTFMAVLYLFYFRFLEFRNMLSIITPWKLTSTAKFLWAAQTR